MRRKINYLILILFMVMFLNVNVKAYSYKTSDIPNNSYVIGTHLFVRKNEYYNDAYKGPLYTKHIMLAAKSINSGNLDDMIIYYKAPDGVWTNELTEETIEDMPVEINIEYRNTIPYLLKPVVNSTLVNYENGYYQYEISISNWMDYCHNADDYEEASKYTFEVYEKNGDEIDSTPIIDDGPFGGARYLNVEAGTKKTFVARVYVLGSDNEKIYSEYSDEFVIDRTASSFDKPGLAIQNERYDSNTFQYVFDVFFAEHGEDAIGSGDPPVGQEIKNYDLWEVKTDDDDEYLGEKNTGQSYSINVEPGTTKKLIAQGFVLNSEGEKITTEYTDEIVLDGTINKKPIVSYTNLTFNQNTGLYSYYMTVENMEEDFAFANINPSVIHSSYEGDPNEYKEYTPLITHFEIEDKITDTGEIRLISEALGNDIVTSPWIWDFEYEFEFTPNQKHEVKIRFYVLNSSNEKVYSEYSDVFVIDSPEITLEKPVLETKNLLLLDNNISGDLGIKMVYPYVTLSTNEYHITGIEYYGSTSDDDMGTTLTYNGTKYYLIENKKVVDGNYVHMDFKANQKLMARVYIENLDGTKVYSDFSSIITVSEQDYINENTEKYKYTLEKLKAAYVYAVKDIDDNGVPELIIRSYDSFGKIILKIFTYENGNVVVAKNENDVYEIKTSISDFRSVNGNIRFEGLYLTFNNELMHLRVLEQGMCFTHKIGLNNSTWSENIRTFDYQMHGLPIWEDVIEFSSFNDKQILENSVSDSNILHDYEELIDNYNRETEYAFVDINKDGQLELIMKELTGKESGRQDENGIEILDYSTYDNVSYRVYYSVGGSEIANYLINTNSNESYLYSNVNDGTIKNVFRVSPTEQKTETYSFNNGYLEKVDSSSQILEENEQIEIQDNLIDFQSIYNYELDNGC